MLAASSAKDLARRRQPRVVRRRDGAPEVLEVPGGSRARAPGPVRGLDVDFHRGGRWSHAPRAILCLLCTACAGQRVFPGAMTGKNIGCTALSRPASCPAGALARAPQIVQLAVVTH